VTCNLPESDEPGAVRGKGDAHNSLARPADGVEEGLRRGCTLPRLKSSKNARPRPHPTKRSLPVRVERSAILAES
jgi:hypothetical protein